MTGKVVATVVSEELSVGPYSWQWNAAKMSGGIYFYSLQAGTFIETKKFILLRYETTSIARANIQCVFTHYSSSKAGQVVKKFSGFEMYCFLITFETIIIIL